MTSSSVLTVLLRRCALFAACVGVIVCASVFGQPADTTTPAPPPATAEVQAAKPSLAEQFATKRAAIDSHDYAKRVELIVWLTKQFKDKQTKARDYEALHMAVEEWKAILAEAPTDPNVSAVTHIVDDLLKKGQAKAVPQLDEVILTMVFTVLGGLGIFLLGMKYMSDGMQAVAGNRLRRMISLATDNRVMGIGTGTLVTCLVQSSSITTVLVVGFVNSGLMLLHQAVAVIIGANIGTTITGWILVVQIGKYGLPLLGAAGLVYLFSNNEKWRYLALATLGLGMVFFGLELMKDGFAPLRDVPAFHGAFQWFTADGFAGVLKCVLVAATLTAIVQSSSATLGITIAIATQGVIDFNTATALVLGMNIGTTITAWLASIGTTTVAKRAAYFHILFNVIGVCIVTPMFFLYVKAIGQWVIATRHVDPQHLNVESTENFEMVITYAIASAHTVFNVLMAALMLPLVRWWANTLEKLVRGKPTKEIGHLTRLDIRMVESPVIGIEQSRGEILKMAEGAQMMFDWTKQIMQQHEPNDELVQKVFHREEVLDKMQHEVIDFITDLLASDVPHSIVEEGRVQLRVADEYESISDYVISLLKSHLRIHNAQLQLSDTERAAVAELHDDVAAYLIMVTQAYRDNDADALTRANTQGDTITHRAKDLRDAHLDRLTKESGISPMLSMSYTTMLNAYRKIKDHALNIVEAVAGQS